MSVSFVRRTAAVALALPLLLSGCTGDDPVPKMPASSSPSSPTSEPTSDEPVEPTLPPEAKGKGNAAAEAFVRHYYATVNYSLKTGDTDPLKQLALKSCDACAGGMGFIDKIYERGGQTKGGELSVVSTVVTSRRAITKDARYFTLDVNIENTKQEITGAGDMNTVYDAGESDLVFDVVSDPTGWHVASWGAK